MKKNPRRRRNKKFAAYIQADRSWRRFFNYTKWKGSVTAGLSRAPSLVPRPSRLVLPPPPGGHFVFDSGGGRVRQQRTSNAPTDAERERERN